MKEPVLVEARIQTFDGEPVKQVLLTNDLNKGEALNFLDKIIEELSHKNPVATLFRSPFPG